MRILFATSEIHPLVKTGGLADVSRSLPLALRQLGIDIQVLVPGYPALLRQLTHAAQESGQVCGPPKAILGNLPEVFPVNLKSGGFNSPLRLMRFHLPTTELPLWVLDCPELFDRPGSPYQDLSGQDWWDNPLRFGVFSRIAQQMCRADSPLPWHPTLLHCNDWQSALAPALLQLEGPATVPTLLTVHNLAFQGNFSASWLQRLGLPSAAFHSAGLEHYGQVSFLKAGLQFAHCISTVSPRYAQEIQTPEFGCGLDGLLRWRQSDLHGILNGIDSEWDPRHDNLLSQCYGPDSLSLKSHNKSALQLAFGLEPDPAVLLIGMVSRLTHQKGIDLVLEALDALLERPVQLVILGSGPAEFESALRERSLKQRGRLGLALTFDETLSHRIIAGSDLLLMPSRFEPCGLTQLYAMTYGTLPLVHRTGGLADTVRDADQPLPRTSDPATGFCFDQLSAGELIRTVDRALQAHAQPSRWLELQHQAMQCDFSWTSAAHSYRACYQRLLGSNGSSPAHSQVINPISKGWASRGWEG